MMKRAKRRLAIRSNYNKGARDLTPSQPVYYQYKEGRRPGWRRDTVRTEHSERSYIIDRRDALNSHKLLEHTDTEKSPDANRLNKSQADSPTRPQRIRKKPGWFKDYEFNF